jgi:hypothetical protein
MSIPTIPDKWIYYIQYTGWVIFLTAITILQLLTLYAFIRRLPKIIAYYLKLFSSKN